MTYDPKDAAALDAVGEALKRAYSADVVGSFMSENARFWKRLLDPTEYDWNESAALRGRWQCFVAPRVARPGARFQIRWAPSYGYRGVNGEGA